MSTIPGSITKVSKSINSTRRTKNFTFKNSVIDLNIGFRASGPPPSIPTKNDEILQVKQNEILNTLKCSIGVKLISNI